MLRLPCAGRWPADIIDSPIAISPCRVDDATPFFKIFGVDGFLRWAIMARLIASALAAMILCGWLPRTAAAPRRT